MFFLRKFKHYIHRYNQNNNAFINGNICGTVKSKYNGYDTYFEYSHTGYLDGAFVIVEDNYFRYSSIKGNYLHGIQVKIKNGVICCAGKYHFGKPKGYFLHLCKDTSYDEYKYYIGSFYVNGVTEYVDLIKMQNRVLVEHKRVIIHTKTIIKNSAIFHKLSSLPYEMKYVLINPRISPNYQIWRNNKLVMIYSVNDYGNNDVEYMFTYYVNDYKIKLTITEQLVYYLGICKKEEVINDLGNVINFDEITFNNRSISSDTSIELYSYQALFKWERTNKNIYYHSYCNVGDGYTAVYKYYKKINKWQRSNCRIDGEK